jgi:hypothetical protein
MRTTKFLCVRLEGVRGSAAVVGVDISIGSYLPCKDEKNQHLGACDIPKSYYRTGKIYTDGSMDHSRGLFISNEDKGFIHNWANQVTRVDVEIYPKIDNGTPNWDGNPNVGRVRFDFDAGSFTHPAHGGLYSPEVGVILLPQLGFAPFLNGTVTEAGSKVPASRGIEIILWGKTPHPEISSRGYPIFSFAIIGVKDGYYHSGPLLKGKYNMVIKDKQNDKHHSLEIDINRTGERIDLLVERDQFGL